MLKKMQRRFIMAAMAAFATVMLMLVVVMFLVLLPACMDFGSV